MTTFASIPDRLNGQNVDVTWWNLLKAAGVTLEGLVGGGGGFKVVTAPMSPYSVNPLTDFDLLIDESLGPVNLIAPSAAAFPAYTFQVKTKTNSGNGGEVTFADLADGLAVVPIAFHVSAKFKNDGVTYYIY